MREDTSPKRKEKVKSSELRQFLFFFHEISDDVQISDIFSKKNPFSFALYSNVTRGLGIGISATLFEGEVQSISVKLFECEKIESDDGRVDRVARNRVARKRVKCVTRNSFRSLKERDVDWKNRSMEELEPTAPGRRGESGEVRCRLPRGAARWPNHWNLNSLAPAGRSC